MTFMRSRGPSTRADVSTATRFARKWGLILLGMAYYTLIFQLTKGVTPCCRYLCLRSRVWRGGGAPAEREDRVWLSYPRGRRGRAGCESGRPWQGSYGTGWTTHMFNLIQPAPDLISTLPSESHTFPNNMHCTREPAHKHFLTQA